ncbi:glycosyltransferase [Candidatus Saccharibacteria bacterium]|nr:glycosyltransferase [Candidatus Saccharibacteria bacterium]MDQ5885139.1 hypothetical protein [Patescibacteria group bacterium]MDQ5953724.1 hypothetical protein [Patescibacteria group bacterium]
MSKPKPLNNQVSSQKVAIVHDWLVGGGAERVVQALHQLYPDAPIYTSYCTKEWRNKLDNKVVTGYLQHLGKFRKYLPLLQYWWFRSLRLKKYDVIIASAGNGQAKAVKKGNATLICYCHTPVHFLWRHYKKYMKRPGFGIFNPIARLGLLIFAGPLRRLDYKAAQKVDIFIANSTHIQADIKQYYNKDAQVIFPPVNTTLFTQKNTANKNRKGVITVGRLVPMKHVDSIVEVCNNNHYPLTIIGKGPELAKLQIKAGLTVQFITNASDEEVAKRVSGAKAFVFASFEDFGVAPVEALAAGTPVVALQKGGAKDYITNRNGVFYQNQSTLELEQAIQKCLAKKWDHTAISKSSQKFAVKEFKTKIKKTVKNSKKLKPNE